MDRSTLSAFLISLSLLLLLVSMLNFAIINAASGKIYFANSTPQANAIAGNAKVLDTMAPTPPPNGGGSGGGQSVSCSCGSGSCSCTFLIPETTTYTLPSCPLSQQQSETYYLSPTQQVNSSNSANALWLLTAPTQPQEYYLDDSLFYSNGNYIAGDACLSSTYTLDSQISMGLNIYYADGSFTPTITSYTIQNPGTMVIEDYGYSPMVDEAIANGFQTRSYIFQEVPSYIQHGLWSWVANFADLQPFSSSTTLNVGYSLSKSCTYIQDNVSIPYSYTCSYSCTDQVSVESQLSNYYIPYNEVLPNNQYNTFKTPILPYMLYSYSVPSPGSLLLPMYMNMSYDIFGPWNYYNPSNTISPFSIDTGSRFFVNYNGVLENSNTGSESMFGIGKHGMKWQSLLSGIPGYESPYVNGPISIAATPNNYIYILNYSTSQKAYFLTILRLVPHGYYNTSNYQPDSVGAAYSKSEWDSNWNTYWANVIELQNASVYVVNSLNLAFLQNQRFTPLNISVDNFGDVFITGNTIGYITVCTIHGCKKEPVTTQPALAEITNTLVNNNWAVVYNSITTNNNQIMPEIAVSPTGSLIYLANQNDSGYVYVYSATNFTQINDINLAYSYSAPGSNYPLASLNIYYWLSNNGLFNQTLPPSIWNFFSNNADVIDIPEYHHPLGLADINGYLYVLDEWSGGIGVNYNKYTTTDTGIWFNILELRVLNSTGSNIPINPTHFNDMFTVSQCGLPIYKPTSETLTSGKCYLFSQYVPSNVICGNNCELTSSPCHTGGGRYIAYGNTYSCISANTLSSTYYTLAPSYYSLNGAYPPYGWILSANITGATLSTGTSWLYSINNPQTVTFCGSMLCGYNPYNLNPANGVKNVNFYNGSYFPIGPMVSAVSMNASSHDAAQMSKLISIGWVPKFSKIGFSANFNDTISILFPNTTPIHPLYDLGIDPIENPNLFKELIITRLNIENYTKLFGGFPPYTCYSNSSAFTGDPGDVCSLLASVRYMNPPVYTDTDAFKFLEGLGSPEIMPLESVAYSTFSGNAPGSSGYCENAANTIESGNTCGGIVPANIIPYSNSIINGQPPSYAFNLLASAETLNSYLSGYALVPYKYTYKITQSWETISGSCPFSGSTTTTQTVYSYGFISTTSNNFKSVIEGGNTYFKYINGAYYIPNLSDMGAIIPKGILFDMLTDRNFTNIYVNVTDSSGLYQTIANATKTANFVINIYTQGRYPAFETISSVPESNTLFGSPAADLILENTLVNTPTFSPLTNVATGMYYFLTSAPSVVNLFDWYKIDLFTNYLDLYLNQSPLGPVIQSSDWYLPAFNTRGYTRIIYVLNDKFNNTIYVPIDADIANITSINLHVKPVVSSDNVNQTTLYITGNATYFDGVKYIPLVDNSIYIYFNNNINYVEYNAILYPVNAVLCAYGNMNCKLANPAFTGLSSNTNIITYYPQYNSLGMCNPPPSTLFQPPIYNCNIYGNNGLPQTCNSIITPAGRITQWCIPAFANGTGTCTSQIGLMGIVTTDQNGNFALTANACGIGSASITATFYGYPYNEPITANQPYLANSAPLVYNYYGKPVNTQPPMATFQVVNYTWSPNQTTVSPVSLGLAELSYGSISIWDIVGLAIISLLIFYIMLKKG